MARRGKSYESKLLGNRDFATTHWSVVLAAGHASSPDADEALAALCESYWLPLYAYARRHFNDTHRAQDLTQAFFTELLAKNSVGRAMPERGRFRAYLLGAFKHFLGHEWERERALKRGGGRPLLSLDFATGDSLFDIAPCAELSADELYERQWAVALLDQVMERLRSDFQEAGKGDQFELLKEFMVGQRAEDTYADVAAAMGTTPAAAKMAASRMRRRYRELLREEIGRTVADPDEIDQEIRDLFSALGK